MGSMGICIISVPKSGTMFLTRSLERAYNVPCIFGLSHDDADIVAESLGGGISAEIARIKSETSPNVGVIARRFSKMLDRNRRLSSGRSALISDHGFHSFPKFLLNPHISDIQDPEDVFGFAAQRNLRVVFLYRDIRHVAASLAHFLVSGKSFLLRCDDLKETGRVVANVYAPVLTELTRVWLARVNDLGGLCLSYDDLVQDPRKWFELIGSAGGLGELSPSDTAISRGYRSWTYRAKRGEWHEAFSADAKQKLEQLNASVMMERAPK